MELLSFTGESGITDFFVLPEGSPLVDWEANRRIPSEGAPGSFSVEMDPAKKNMATLPWFISAHKLGPMAATIYDPDRDRLAFARAQ